MNTQNIIPIKWMAAAALAILISNRCPAAQHPPDVRIKATTQYNIEPTSVRIDLEPTGAVLRGAVYRGPGYERWQKNHLRVEIIAADGRTNLTENVAFSPEPIPKVGRASGRSSFSLALKQTPAPGSTVRITPQEGDCPKIADR